VRSMPRYMLQAERGTRGMKKLMSQAALFLFSH
jgi:hypothetical protein